MAATSRGVEGAVEVPDTSVSFTAELRALKQHLQCARHDGRFCYVSKITGEHEFQDIYKLTSWAKSIVKPFFFSISSLLYFLQMFKEATYENPPSAKEFDHVAKKRRRPNDTATTPPSIHVHIPDAAILQAHTLRMPLANRTARRLDKPQISKTPFIDLTADSDNDSPLISFPPISQALADLHVVMPLHNYPQYEPALISKGILYMNNTSSLAHSFFVDIVGLPDGAVGAFLEHCATLTRRACKGKAKSSQAVVKKEEVNVEIKEEDREN